MPTRPTEKLLVTALRLATKAFEERASAEDLQDLALTVLELDEAIVVDGAPPPKRWDGSSCRRRRRSKASV